MSGASSIDSQSDWARPNPSTRNRCASSNAPVAKTTWPKPTPDVRNPPGTNADSNGVAAAWRPTTSSTSTPHGLVVRSSRRTRRARRSASLPSSSSNPAATNRCAIESRAASSTASKPTKRASFDGPGCTITRCTLSSSRQATTPSDDSASSRPITPPKNVVNDDGSGISMPR